MNSKKNQTELNLQLDFSLNQTVYLKTDISQYPRMVSGILIRPNNMIIYYLVSGTEETSHFNTELSSVQDVMLKTSN